MAVARKKAGRKRAAGISASAARTREVNAKPRMMVVYNPNSSRYATVKKEVLARLVKLKGFLVGKYEISTKGFEYNVSQISKILRDGDFVVVAGGDGTAAVTVNGILKSGKDVVFAALPYGNFNDLARTLRLTSFDDILEAVLDDAEEAKTNKNTTLKNLQISKNFKVVNLYPLKVLVDEKLWRYASSYVTIGMTAEACEVFDYKDVRKEMQRDKTNKWKPYIYMAKWYFKNRKRQFLPKFLLNGRATVRGASDYAAVSGTHMARVMKGGNDFLKPRVFRSEVDRLTNFGRLFVLMFKAMFFRTPGSETARDVLEFLENGEVELQAEGEYAKFVNPKKIEVLKTGEFMRVLMKK